MTRAETVRLSPGNWIALAVLVLMIVSALVGGVWSIADQLGGLRSEIRYFGGTVQELSRRVERLEDGPRGKP